MSPTRRALVCLVAMLLQTMAVAQSHRRSVSLGPHHQSSVSKTSIRASPTTGQRDVVSLQHAAMLSHSFPDANTTGVKKSLGQMGERRPPLRPLPMVSRRKPPMKVNRLTRALLPPPPPGMEPFSPAVRSARLPELLNFWRNFPFIEKQIQLEEALADDTENAVRTLTADKKGALLGRIPVLKRKHWQERKHPPTSTTSSTTTATTTTTSEAATIIVSSTQPPGESTVPNEAKETVTILQPNPESPTVSTLRFEGQNPSGAVLPQIIAELENARIMPIATKSLPPDFPAPVKKTRKGWSTFKKMSLSKVSAGSIEKEKLRVSKQREVLHFSAKQHDFLAVDNFRGLDNNLKPVKVSSSGEFPIDQSSEEISPEQNNVVQPERATLTTATPLAPTTSTSDASTDSTTTTLLPSTTFLNFDNETSAEADNDTATSLLEMITHTPSPVTITVPLPASVTDTSVGKPATKLISSAINNPKHHIRNDSKQKKNKSSRLTHPKISQGQDSSKNQQTKSPHLSNRLLRVQSNMSNRSQHSSRHAASKNSHTSSSAGSSNRIRITSMKISNHIPLRKIQLLKVTAKSLQSRSNNLTRSQKKRKQSDSQSPKVVASTKALPQPIKKNARTISSRKRAPDALHRRHAAAMMTRF
ncbi:hypothetical protein Q1695_002562 [Nippostrongylus brasiliensis]|nr:hypothetical protein Q1695_002562 [Nippostrongylus brasiliensis]